MIRETNKPNNGHCIFNSPNNQSSSLSQKSMATAFSLTLPSIPNLRLNHRVTVTFIKPLHCAPIHQQVDPDVDAAIMCEPCNGKGWLLCDFCKGQKTNVRADNKRVYRRCPSCRAVGFVLCPSCKVFKCVTFPDLSDAQASST